MGKILVAYATLSGSTTEVARAVGEEFVRHHVDVDVLSLGEVTDLAAYDAVVVGAPMIMGWHQSALTFLRKHRRALAGTPVALFATAMSLVTRGETAVKGVPVCLDQKLAKPPQNPQRPTLRERYASLPNYASPMLRAAGSSSVVAIGFFGGKLDYFRLKPLPRLFVMLAVQAQPGDRRNWDVIRSWAVGLPALFYPQKRSG